MSDQRQDEFGSVQATYRMWLFFEEQTELLGQLYSSLLTESGERWRVLVPLAYSIQDSCETIFLLAQRGKMRDCFIVARTVIETILNCCFICAEGEEAAARAEKHAIQKSYRDLQRELDIKQRELILRWTGHVDVSSNPELQAAIAEFTSKKGREIRSWTSESVRERIEAIEARYGSEVASYLQVALFAIYRHASDLAHGTLFGALFALGVTSPTGPPISKEVLATHHRGNITMLLMVLGFAISSLLRVVADELPLQYLVAKSDAAIKELSKEGWVK